MYVQVLEKENRVAEAEEQLMSHQSNPLILPFGFVPQKYPNSENLLVYVLFHSLLPILSIFTSMIL
jgi:hypothetical protein